MIYIMVFSLMVKKIKSKKPTRSKLVQKADSVFSTYIRLRDSDKNWFVKCPLCWAKIHWKKAQNMHFITRACWLYRYDETNCFAWCYRCNCILNWNYIIYTRFMQDKFWIEKVDEMIRESKQIYKLPTYELEEIIDTYTNKIQKFARKLTL